METNNTKGAIEFCKDLEEIDFRYGRVEYDMNPHIENVIEFLQRGEKYAKIVDKIEKEYGYFYYGSSENLYSIITRLKQKYFPKPKEKPYEELLENILWKAIKDVIGNSSELILKCMEKAEKDKRENKIEDRPIKQSRMDYMEKGARIGKPREGKKKTKDEIKKQNEYEKIMDMWFGNLSDSQKADVAYNLWEGLSYGDKKEEFELE